MKRITRVLILLLALCMLVSCFAACNKKTPDKKPAPTDGGNNANTTPGGQQEEVTTPPDEGPQIVMPEVIDMDGYTYRAYVRDFAGTSPDAHKAQVANGNNDYRCVDFWVDEANSENDFISFAVYNRNKQIEADYNCKIRQVSSDGSQIEHLLASFTNGDSYDLTIITAKPAAQAATQNLLRNLAEANPAHLDLNHASFDQNAINELRVADKLYCVSVSEGYYICVGNEFLLDLSSACTFRIGMTRKNYYIVCKFFKIHSYPPQRLIFYYSSTASIKCQQTEAQ